jgi:hypothetical protein
MPDNPVNSVVALLGAAAAAVCVPALGVRGALCVLAAALVAVRMRIGQWPLNAPPVRDAALGHIAVISAFLLLSEIFVVS